MLQHGQNHPYLRKDYANLLFKLEMAFKQEELLEERFRREIPAAESVDLSLCVKALRLLRAFLDPFRSEQLKII